MNAALDLKAAKAAMRREILARRAMLTADEVAERSQRIVQNALSLPALAEADTVLLFASFGTELNTGELISACLRAGQDVVLPRICRDPRRLDLYTINDWQRDVRPGPWGIPQPIPERCPEVMPRDVDFAFVPGVAFDLDGNRLGYGGGFYDMLLPQLRLALAAGAVVGLAFELQIVDTVPHKPKDVPVPLLATEKRIIHTTAAQSRSRGR